MTRRQPRQRRRLGHDPGRYRTGQSWTHLLFFVFLLVLLLLFYSELGRGAAGCFGAVADPDAQIEVGPSAKPDTEPASPAVPAPQRGSVGVKRLKIQL